MHSRAIPHLPPEQPSDAPGNRWGGLPMMEFTGSPSEIIRLIPRFEKLAPECLGLGANRHSDVVVAHTAGGTAPVPVGLVSKTYKLVQHGELIERALKWIKSLPGAEEPARVELSATANLERILARFGMGANLSISPDGEPVVLQLLCRNSVDGSTAIRARLGWFRLVCSNGLIVGVTLGRARLTHKPDADLDDAFVPLNEEIGLVAKDNPLRGCHEAGS